MLKESVGKKFNVSPDELVVCDVWKSKIHREFKDRDAVQDIQRRTDDVFVYHVPKAADPGPSGEEKENNNKNEENNNENNEDENIPYSTRIYPICMEAKQKKGFFRGGGGSEPFGIPLIVNLPYKVVSMDYLYKRLYNLAKPFMKSQKGSGDKEKETAPFQIFSLIGFNQIEEITDEDNKIVDLVGQRQVKFVIQWNDADLYNTKWYEYKHRPRDETAPNAQNESRNSHRNMDKPIPLRNCIESYTEKEILGENDAWYCNKCKAHKRAEKKIDLWSVPDILIIHLKRFSYTRTWR